MSDKIIQITEMNKWFGDFQVLKNINLEVEKNKKIVVCGPSGSGKSTFINLIPRLMDPVKGNVYIDDQNIKKFIEENPDYILGVLREYQLAQNKLEQEKRDVEGKLHANGSYFQNKK